MTAASGQTGSQCLAALDLETANVGSREARAILIRVMAILTALVRR